MRIIIGILWVAVLTVLAPVAASSHEPAQTPLLPDEVKARSYFTDSKLLTHEGEEVRFFSDVLANRIVIINGFYTGCEGLSPRQAQVLTSLQDMLGDSLGKEVFIVSITVDPENDTVEKLAEFAREQKAKPGWLFLTGDPEDVDRVNRKLGQYKEAPEDHAGIYVMGNVKTGLWMKIPLHAMSRDLYLQAQRLVEDKGEMPGSE